MRFTLAAELRDSLCRTISCHGQHHIPAMRRCITNHLCWLANRGQILLLVYLLYLLKANAININKCIVYCSI